MYSWAFGFSIDPDDMRFSIYRGRFPMVPLFEQRSRSQDRAESLKKRSHDFQPFWQFKFSLNTTTMLYTGYLVRLPIFSFLCLRLRSCGTYGGKVLSSGRKATPPRDITRNLPIDPETISFVRLKAQNFCWETIGIFCESFWQTFGIDQKDGDSHYWNVKLTNSVDGVGRSAPCRSVTILSIIWFAIIKQGIWSYGRNGIVLRFFWRIEMISS